MLPYTIDALALLALGGGFIIVSVGWWLWRLDRALRDPEHPDHDAAREAVLQDDDIWRFL